MVSQLSRNQNQSLQPDCYGQNPDYVNKKVVDVEGGNCGYISSLSPTDQRDLPQRLIVCCRNFFGRKEVHSLPIEYVVTVTEYEVLVKLTSEQIKKELWRTPVDEEAGYEFYGDQDMEEPPPLLFW